MIRHRLVSILLLSLTVCAVADEPRPAAPASAKRVFLPSGVPADDNYFPIAVWLQSTRNAARYKEAGINLYVGLWNGPTPVQLAELEKAGMPVICSQNESGIAQIDNRVIAGWMHGDEPDNAQSLGRGKGYGPPVLPAKIIEDYKRIRAADPSRPVLVNLGQGVAWDNYIGRGSRRNHPEDYAEYAKGGDIASFDIYPAVHDSPEIAGKLEFVAKGIERLSAWTGGKKPVWSCIECTHISNPTTKATPRQVRAEVWMALIRGARGLIYFVHQFQPSFKEAALLDDPEMLSAITGINRQIHDLAAVLNSPTVDEVTVKSSDPEVPIASMMKVRGDTGYIFAVNLGNRAGRGRFSGLDTSKYSKATALSETRELPLRDAVFADEFEPYGVHLYQLSK